MKQVVTTILSNDPLSDSFYEMSFTWDIEQTPLPGQFCTIRVSPFSAPLLRRPFAFSDFDATDKKASVIYKQRGPATGLLAAKREGDTLDIIGPLGSSFPLKDCEPLVCLAGGTGFGPMLFLARQSIEMGKKTSLIIGYKTLSQVPALASLSACDPIFTTDDGSAGHKGTPLDYLSSVNNVFGKNTTVCACGPVPLMRGCAQWAKACAFPCFVSLEQVMACGVGACMGCAVKVIDASKNGYARACIEGPVFPAERVVWT
jgi:dihydroorotate dehydrogenase electron transfer subunit